MNRLAERTYLAFEAGGALALGLAIVAAAVLAVLAWRAVSRAARRRRGVLLALRVALALAVVVLALRPVVRTESLSVRTTPVAVLVDASASMGVRDQAGGAARLEAVAEWARRHAGVLDALSGEALVEWFVTADGDVRATSRADVVEGRVVAAGGTDLATALESLAERYPGRVRPSVLLVSDGADHGELARLVRAGDTVGVEALVAEGGAIVPVAPDAGGLADLAVDLIAHDPIGFLRTDVTIRARVRAAGFAEQEVPVSLLRGGELVTVRPVRVGGADSGAVDVEFTVRPTEVGEALYRLQVPVRSGEAVVTNNEAQVAIRVVRDRVRVLQVVGRPSWDGRFLRELLKRDPAIDLVSFFILRQAWDDTNTDDVSELSLIPFPVAELFGEKLRGFDLVVFQNFDLGPYGIGAHAPELRRHVAERGGALAIIGGDLGFDRDYRRAELAEVLPVELQRRVEWRGGAQEIAATEIGLRHPILSLGLPEGAVAAAVEALAPVAGLNEGLVPKPAAQVLLETADAARRPVLVVGQAGAGRVLVLSTDGTWRWSLPAAGQGQSPRGYERFWENAIRWLLKDPRSSLAVLEADRRAIGSGETLEVRVHVRRPTYEPDARVPVTLTVREVTTGQETVHRLETDEHGVAVHVFEPERPGLHAFVASTPRGDAGPLHVERIDPGRELAAPAVDARPLEALADATAGGALRRLSDDGLDVPFAASRDVRVEAVRTWPLWRTWWAWAAVAGLACTEWWLRRRWGLA